MSQTPTADVQHPSDGGRPPRNPFARLWLFLKQVIDELRKVIVPTRSELINYTIVVLVFVLIVIGIVTGLDWVLDNLAEIVFGGAGAQQ